MVIKKRCLLWDWTNTRDVPNQMAKVDFGGPMHSVSNVSLGRMSKWPLT